MFNKPTRNNIKIKYYINSTCVLHIEPPKFIIHANSLTIITEQQQKPTEATSVIAKATTKEMELHSSFSLPCGVQTNYGIDVTYVWSFFGVDIPFDRLSILMRKYDPTQFAMVHLNSLTWNFHFTPNRVNISLPSMILII